MHSLEKADDFKSTRERMSALRPEDERRWGVMTAPETVCHLRGAFLVAMGEIASEPLSLPVPAPVIKAAALWAPVPWKQNFVTVPALKRGGVGMESAGFAQDLRDAFEAMERFCRPEQTRVDHSMFGPMSFGDWMRWGYLHTDHHLRQFGR